MIAGWAVVAMAAEGGGFYHPDDVARASSAFAAASEVSAGAYERAESVSMRYAEGLNAYEEALDLLGIRADAAERDRYRKLRHEFDTRHAEVSVFASDLADAYNEAFSGALERALPALAPGAVRCVREVPLGRPLPGIRTRTAPNPECQGVDHNAALAAAMDADARLTVELAELNARVWPPFELPADKVAAVGGSGRWIDVHAFFERAARPTLQRLTSLDDEQRLPLQQAMEEGTDPALLAVEARRIAERTASARAAFAAPVLAAARAFSDKHGEPFGWCANPRDLGGCAGEDATDALTELLLADRKVAAALARQADR